MEAIGYLDTYILLRKFKYGQLVENKAPSARMSLYVGFQKEDTSIADLEERLHEGIQFSLRKYKGSSYNHLAYVKHLEGLNKEALTFLEQAEEVTRKGHGDEFENRVIVTYGNFAWVYYHMREITKAENYLEKLEDICKKFNNTASRYSVLLPAVNGEKGLSFLKVCEKYYHRAKECIEKALAEEPAEKEWNIGYAIALYRLERIEQEDTTVKHSAALKQLRYAQKLDPENPIIVVLLGLKHQECKQHEKALELVEQALKMSPDNPQVIRYVAKFYRKQKSFDKSLELLTEALKKSPSSRFLNYEIALCYKSKVSVLKRQGDHYQNNTNICQLSRQCIFHLEKVAQSNPSFVYPQLDLAEMYAEYENIQKAEELFQTLFRLTTISPEERQTLHHRYGFFQLQYNKSESGAIKHYKEGFKIQYPSLEREKCYDKLEEISRRCMARNPNDGEAFGILGFIHQMKDNKLQAIEFYEKALLCDHGNEEYLSALCDLHLSLNEND